MKICPRCSKEFNTSSSRCPSCHNQYQKDKGYNAKYYREHKQEFLNRVKNSAENKRRALRKAKEKPCADCGIQYPYWVMQFDHVRGKKEFNICMKLYHTGLKKLLAEVSKCDIVCANCHANRTYQRQKKLACSIMSKSADFQSAVQSANL